MEVAAILELGVQAKALVGTPIYVEEGGMDKHNLDMFPEEKPVDSASLTTFHRLLPAEKARQVRKIVYTFHGVGDESRPLQEALKTHIS